MILFVQLSRREIYSWISFFLVEIEFDLEILYEKKKNILVVRMEYVGQGFRGFLRRVCLVSEKYEEVQKQSIY